MMDDSNRITRYLLGELPEDEQAALEERYVADPSVFDEVTKAESDLVDDYVRGKLPADVRQRFERVFLVHPQRRERVKFAEALAARLDRPETTAAAGAPASVAADPGPGWRTWIDGLRRPMPALGLAFATLVIVSGGWLVFEVRRTRQEAVQRAAAAEQPRADQGTPAPSPTFVVVALTVGPGVRAADAASPTPVAIPADTAEVRLQLTIQEHEYVTYRVIFRAVGGGDVARRGPLTLTPAGSGATITLTVPAGQFQSGDYILTLQGQTRAGDIEDVSQSILRVDKR